MQKRGVVSSFISLNRLSWRKQKNLKKRPFFQIFKSIYKLSLIFLRQKLKKEKANILKKKKEEASLKMTINQVFRFSKEDVSQKKAVFSLLKSSPLFVEMIKKPFSFFKREMFPFNIKEYLDLNSEKLFNIKLAISFIF